jgi:hypothetical protein
VGLSSYAGLAAVLLALPANRLVLTDFLSFVAV